MRQIYFDSQYGLEKYAMREDGELKEYVAEYSERGAAVGNIYKGRVTDVLPGMQAAFVDCGLERHCYLSVTKTVAEATPAETAGLDAPEILDLHEGDEIMVQIVKPAGGKKGAKITTRISFTGKYMIYLPETPFIGISAKITDRELRKNLEFSARKMLGDGEGIIVRTAAPYALFIDKIGELSYYRNLYAGLKAQFKRATVGELLYSDSPLHIRTLRDLIINPGDEIHVGAPEIYGKICELVDSFYGKRKAEVILHDPHTDLFHKDKINEQFTKSLRQKIELANGAYIIIEQTEALTVVDVNTGKFTGEDSLEHTVYYTNVLATREIARQVHLRNLGGIFVVDFIDMSEEKHKKAIVQELEKALAAVDKGKCKVLPMSKFGLVEFTRRRTGLTAAQFFRTPCKTCGGIGIVRSVESIVEEFRARLLEILSDGSPTICADVNFETGNRLLNYPALIANVAALYPQARVYVVLHRTYKEDAMYFRKIDSSNFSLPEGTMLLY